MRSTMAAVARWVSNLLRAAFWALLLLCPIELLAQELEVLHHFDGAEGASPTGRLVEGPDGHFYALTSSGGSHNRGNLVRMTPDGQVTVLRGLSAETGYGPSYVPTGGLVLARDGLFYGVTGLGGAHGHGTILSGATDGTLMVLHSFTAEDDVAVGPLVEASDGHLYGATRTSVFRITKGGVVTHLRRFNEGESDPLGNTLLVPIVYGSDGFLYGVTLHNGGVFRMSLAGEASQVYRFREDDGWWVNNLVQARDGYLYVTTRTAVQDPARRGVILRISLAGAATTIARHGAYISDYSPQPLSTLTPGRDGCVYGTASNLYLQTLWVPINGAVFRICAGVLKVLHRFTRADDVLGYQPTAPLAQAADGFFYGLMRWGGRFQAGTAFRFRAPVIAPFSIAAIVRPQRVVLSWSAVPGAGQYVVYRGVTPDVLGSLGTVTGTSVQDVGVVPGQQYYYRVAVVSPWGEGEHSAIVVAHVGQAVTADLDGDARSDLVSYQRATGQWSVRTSSSGYQETTAHGFGGPGDVPLLGDFDGDGRQDLVTYRPSLGYWFIRTSSSGYTGERAYHLGANGDVPLAADFDGDGKTDLTVYRPSDGRWYIWQSTGGLAVYQWGIESDRPIVADFDGDGKTELTVYRPASGEWLVAFSRAAYQSSGWTIQKWGDLGDVPVASDYDGDGRTDLAVYRPSEGLWFVWGSATLALGSWQVYRWGGAGLDRPIVQDFDGDGRADLATYRPTTGEWFVMAPRKVADDTAGVRFFG